MMRSLGDILNNKNSSSPLVRGVRAAQVIEIAQKILAEEFGPAIKDHVTPAYYKYQTLTIACLSSTAAQEIKLREEAIIQMINKALNGVTVARIKYLS